MPADPDTRYDEIVRKDVRYTREAYDFVSEALQYTIKRKGVPGHISGQELLAGIRGYAKERFGLLARAVFNSWGVKRTEDFGEIVFNMVKHNLLQKRAEDSIADFCDGYNFRHAFEEEFDFEI